MNEREERKYLNAVDLLHDLLDEESFQTMLENSSLSVREYDELFSLIENWIFAQSNNED
jgi:hypothetical protein